MKSNWNNFWVYTQGIKKNVFFDSFVGENVVLGLLEFKAWLDIFFRCSNSIIIKTIWSIWKLECYGLGKNLPIDVKM